MRVDIRKIISRSLMITGAILLLTCALFYAVSYPWRIVLQKMGFEVSQELPDPKPLPENLVSKVDTSKTTLAEQLPDTTSRFEIREDVPLEQIGVLKFPRLGISENIVLGSGDELLYGIGHIEGTAMPGQPGNCVLPGHRNYFVMHPFMYLDKAVPGDRVQIIDVEQKTYTYEVYKVFSVYPEEVWVSALQEEETSMLTLITCSPGLEPSHRIIVWCRLVEV